MFLPAATTQPPRQSEVVAFPYFGRSDLAESVNTNLAVHDWSGFANISTVHHGSQAYSTTPPAGLKQEPADRNDNTRYLLAGSHSPGFISGTQYAQCSAPSPSNPPQLRQQTSSLSCASSDARDSQKSSAPKKNPIRFSIHNTWIPGRPEDKQTLMPVQTGVGIKVPGCGRGSATTRSGPGAQVQR